MSFFIKNPKATETADRTRPAIVRIFFICMMNGLLFCYVMSDYSYVANTTVLSSVSVS
jgi:hypothetical protein